MQGSARSTLVSAVEEHISGLIREAMTVQRHAKRARLHHDNGGGDPGSGGSNHHPRPVIRRRLHAADVNLALQLRGSEKLYGTAVVVPDADDTTRKVPLEDFLRQEAEAFPSAPSEVGLRMHWLAVDGTQPAIPQNPSPADAAAAAVSSVDGRGAIGGTAAAMAGARATGGAAALGDVDGEGGSAQLPGGLRVMQLQASLLSEELQLYFARVTLAMERGGPTRRQQDAVLLSVSRDPGLQELVPFLVRYCQQELYRHVGNAEHCRTLVRLASSLLHNPHLHLELHLHELLPALMTCVVAKRLSSDRSNHWALRREAAQALVRACGLFGDEYATLKARVLGTLCDAILPNKTLPTRYGGWVAISLFGAKAVDAFLLPVATTYWREWERALSSRQDCGAGSDPDPPHHHEIRMCQQAALSALGVFLQRVDDAAKAARVDWNDLEETFADRLVVLRGDELSEYASSFI